MLQDLLERLIVALTIGFLVGVERGWQARDVADGGRVAGIRTYALIGVLGGLSAILARLAGAWAMAALAIPAGVAIVAFSLRETQGKEDYSATGVIAALLVFALGAVAVLGDWRLASAAGVAVTALLASKRGLHGWLKNVTWPELRSALVLLAMSFVVLPILPDHGFGPYGAFNPHELWLLTIAIAGVSFLAYVTIRLLGAESGLYLGAVAGSLVSSTAVMLDLARRTREAPGACVASAGAGLLAGAVMVARVGVISGVMAPPLLWRLLPALAAFAGVSLAASAMLARSAAKTVLPEMAKATNPFELRAVAKFALVLGLIIAASRMLTALYGAQNLPLIGAIAGLVDVDALTLAVGELSANGLDLAIGATAVLTAVAVDTGSKTVIALVVGGRRFGARVALGSALATLAGGAAFLLAPPLPWI